MPDLADKAIEYVRQQKSLTPDKPFFVYFAPGATHTPHHVPKDWIAKYKGKFDHGWDAVRDATFEQQKRLNVIPADSTLTARPSDIPGWAETDDAMKSILAHQMEVYPAFLSYADHHIGRVVDARDELGVLEETLIYYIIGDNGASAEGGLNGAFMVTTASNGGAEVENLEFWKAHIDEIGGPTASTIMPSPGRTRCARPINGPSRWRRIMAARAMARSFTGRLASRVRARCAGNGTMSSMWRRPSSMWQGSPSHTP